MRVASLAFERMRKIARLYAETGTPGEREAAAAAFLRTSAGTQWDGLPVDEFVRQSKRRMSEDVLRRTLANEAARRKAVAQVARLMRWNDCDGYTRAELASLRSMSESLKRMPPSKMESTWLGKLEKDIPTRVALLTAVRRATYGRSPATNRPVRRAAATKGLT